MVENVRLDYEGRGMVGGGLTSQRGKNGLKDSDLFTLVHTNGIGKELLT